MTEQEQTADQAYLNASLDERSKEYLLGYLTSRLDAFGKVTKDEFVAAVRKADGYFTQRAIGGQS